MSEIIKHSLQSQTTITLHFNSDIQYACSVLQAKNSVTSAFATITNNMYAQYRMLYCKVIALTVKRNGTQRRIKVNP